MFKEIDKIFTNLHPKQAHTKLEKMVFHGAGWNSIGTSSEKARSGGRQGEDQSDQASTSSINLK